MDRRLLITTGLGLAAVSFIDKARAQGGGFTPMEVQPDPAGPPPSAYDRPPASGAQPAPPAGYGYDQNSQYQDRPPSSRYYTREELAAQASNFFGVTAEAVGGVIERAFADNGEPVGYIAGQEGSGALTIGARYGKGVLYMKERPPTEIYWQGPSIGWDIGGNASRVFTLVYGMTDPVQIFQRFPGVEGAAYVVGGMGVNYQRASGVTLAPIRAGVGLRLGANVGYMVYSRQRNIIPL